MILVGFILRKEKRVRRKVLSLLSQVESCFAQTVHSTPAAMLARLKSKSKSFSIYNKNHKSNRFWFHRNLKNSNMTSNFIIGFKLQGRVTVSWCTSPAKPCVKLPGYKPSKSSEINKIFVAGVPGLDEFNVINSMKSIGSPISEVCTIGGHQHSTVLLM